MKTFDVTIDHGVDLLTLNDIGKRVASKPSIDPKVAAALRPHKDRHAKAVADALAQLDLSHQQCDEAMAECGELAAQLAVADRRIELLRAAIRREGEKLADVTRKLELAAAGK